MNEDTGNVLNPQRWVKAENKVTSDLQLTCTFYSGSYDHGDNEWTSGRIRQFW